MDGRDGADETVTQLTNWAGNVRFRAARIRRPCSTAELREHVAGAARARVLGSGHSFSAVADTAGDLVLLDALPREVVVDPSSRTATVSASIRLGALAAELHRAGLALGNLPSLPHISVAGAYATGTHGAGVTNGCLATAVERMEVVTAAGESRVVARGDDDFGAVVVGLGCFGVVTRLTLRLQPGYDVAQTVHDDLPLGALLDGVDGILAAAYSVSVFTRYGDDSQVWVKRRVGDPPVDLTWTGATPASGPRHPIPGMPGPFCTQQLGVPGPWHERLPHFRIDHTPSSGDEVQSEYLVGAADARDALLALVAIRDVVRPALQIAEIRAVAGDEHWLCPSAGRDSVAFHFTWVRDEREVLPAMKAVEAALAPFGPRPHWGKLSGVPAAEVAASYPRWADFVAVADRSDPAGVFRNELTDAWLGRGPE